MYSDYPLCKASPMILLNGKSDFGGGYFLALAPVGTKNPILGLHVQALQLLVSVLFLEHFELKLPAVYESVILINYGSLKQLLPALHSYFPTIATKLTELFTITKLSISTLK